MKYLIYVFICLLNIPALVAQTGNPPLSSNEKNAAASSEARVVDFKIEEKTRNEELNRLVAEYHKSPLQGEKNELQVKIQETLLIIFELGLLGLEQEAIALSQDLKNMESTPSLQGKTRDIKTLQTSLDKVNSRLDFRRANRNKIVSHRLSELLSTGDK